MNQAINYRPYQRQAIEAIKTDWANGHSDVLLTVATGGGKTIIFLGLLAEILHHFPERRCIIIAHRKELIDQPIERLAMFWPHLRSRSGIVMANQDDCSKQIIVATVQTLNGAGRLERILEHGPIDYLVTDEAHHAVADTYLKVYERLRVANHNIRHLGVTATPLRADRMGLKKVFEKESAHYGIKELVKLGYLAPPRWLAIQTGISLAGVGKSGTGEDRDYNARQLADVYETDNCFDLVVESHNKFANGRPAICFTASVEGAYRLADKFNEAGIPAAAADGKTAKEERTQIIKDFRAGKLQVLCNVALWTEGLDLPEISCIHMVRPTQSDAYYVQCIGRGLRILPGKEDALILDYAPLEVRNVAMLGDVLGVEVSKKNYMADVEPGEVVAGFTFDGEVKWMHGDPMEIVGRTLDYLNLSPWRWCKPDRQGWMVLSLGKSDADKAERVLAISPAAEKMELWGIWKKEDDRWHQARKLNEGTFEELSDIADEFAHKWGNPALAKKQMGWRAQPPSDGQIKFANRLGVFREGMSKGEVADAITYRLAMQTLRRSGANA